ncbi:MAG: zinc-dependent metalloprotease [Thermoflavifilum sp.]|nr:zinc-dependent metalloprotease [Thermoflavifilum sp.]
MFFSISLRQWVVCCLTIIVCSSCNKQNSSSPSSDQLPASNNQPVGASAHDLLSAQHYDSLLVTIAYMPQFAPDQQALQNLQQFLQQHLNKPAGIQIVLQSIPSGNQSTYSLQDIEHLETTYRKSFNSQQQISVFILYVDGQYTNAQVLGITYRNTSVCIFGKTIHQNSGGVGQASRTAVESTVLEHEFGHMLGLVNDGSPMQTPHEDSAHPHHCNNQNCLMYYQTETTDLFGFLIGSPIPSLDNNCVSDLQANGGK